jgi:hypothetical protein
MGAHYQKFAVVSGRGALDELAVIGGSDTARSLRKANATPATGRRRHRSRQSHLAADQHGEDYIRHSAERHRPSSHKQM